MNWLSRVRDALPFINKRETPDNLWFKCPSCSESTKPWSNDIGKPLPDEFSIGMMTTVGHRICDNCAEQTLNRTKQSDRDCGTNDRAQIDRHQVRHLTRPWNREGRKSNRNSTECLAVDH